MSELAKILRVVAEVESAAGVPPRDGPIGYAPRESTRDAELEIDKRNRALVLAEAVAELHDLRLLAIDCAYRAEAACRPETATELRAAANRAETARTGLLMLARDLERESSE